MSPEIIIRIEVPEGSTVRVGDAGVYREIVPRQTIGAPAPEWDGLTNAEPPAPDATPPQKVPAPWSEGSCPRHNVEWKQGQFGPYCTSQESDTRFANRKGYCKLRPGDLYQGRLIPRLVA